MDLTQALINGVSGGLLIAVIGLAFATVYASSGVFHLALAAIYLLAPLLTWSLRARDTPWFLAMPVVVLVSSALSVLCEALNHRRLFRRKASAIAHLISSLGIYLMLMHAGSMFWGDHTRVLGTSVDRTWTLGSAVVTETQTAVVIVGVVCLVVYHVLMQKTPLGLDLRAIAANTAEAELRGINVPRLRLSAFGIAGALAAVAGILAALRTGFRPQDGGLPALTLGVVAFIVGGRSSSGGLLIGGVVVGIVRSGAEYLSSSLWQDAVTYVLLGLFLVVRPQGILGTQPARGSLA